MQSKPETPESTRTGELTDSTGDAWDYLLTSYFPSRQQRIREQLRTALGIVLGLVVVFLAVVLLVEFGLPAFHGARVWWIEESKLNPREVREEVDFLKKSLYEGHPRPFEFVRKSELDRRFAKIAAESKSISKRDFYSKAAPVIAQVGCGHTALLPSPSFTRAFIKGASLLPLRAVVLGERLFASQAYDEDAVPLLGTEILAINGRDAREIAELLIDSQSRDGVNPSLAIYKVNDLFPFLYNILVENPRRFVIRARASKGPLEYRIASAPARQVVAEYRRQNPRRNYFEVRHRLEIVTLEEKSAAYLGIPSFQGTGRNREAMQRFFESLDRAGISNLVVDLRGNTGGDPILAIMLLRYLLSEPFQYLSDSNEAVEMFTDFGFERYYETILPFRESGYRGRLYVLADGGSFSQTGQVASMLKAAGIATFVGEESGGGFSCNDNSTLVDMPHSGFRLKLARTGFETSANSLPRGRGILPDVEIRPTIEDLLSKRDPILEWIDARLGTDFRLRVGASSK